MILQSPAINPRFDKSLICKRQANIAGEPLSSIKPKEPRLSGLGTFYCYLSGGDGHPDGRDQRGIGRVPDMEGNTELPTLFAALQIEDQGAGVVTHLRNGSALCRHVRKQQTGTGWRKTVDVRGNAEAFLLSLCSFRFQSWFDPVCKSQHHRHRVL